MPNQTVGGDQTPEGSPLAEYDHRGKFEPEEIDLPPAPSRAEPEPRAGKPALSRALAQMAADYGFTAEEIETGDPAALEGAVLLEHRRMVAAARENRLQELPGSRPAAPPAAPPAEAELEFDHEIDDRDAEGNPVRRKATEKDYDPGLVRHMKGTAKELKELKDSLAEFRRAAAAERQRARVETIDAAFDSLPPQLKKLLGSGPDVAKNPKSKEYKRRVIIMGAAGVDFNNDTPQQLRDKIIGESNDFFGLESAAPSGGAYAEVPDEPEEETPPARAGGREAPAPARATPPKDPATGRFLPPEPTDDEGVRDRRAAWAGAGLPRPSNRTARDLPKGEKRAAATAEAMLREMYPDADLDAPVGLS